MVNKESVEITGSDKAMVYLLLCTAFSLFLFSEATRTMLNQSKLNSELNILYICFGILTIGLLSLKECMDLKIVLGAIAFLGGAIIIQVAEGQHLIQQYLSVVVTMFMPFQTTAFRLPEAVFKSFLEKFIMATNIVCFILVGIGIIDYLSGATIQMFLVQHHLISSSMATLVLLERSSGIYRYYSFMGHPLTNAWYLLVFYTLNILYNRYFKQFSNEYLVTLVTLIGLLLCGSRTALIIGLLMCAFLNNRKHKAAFLLLFLLLSAGLALTPLFQDNLMQRFMIGKDSGDFSEGRNIAFSRVVNAFVKPPEFFVGGGIGFSRQVTLMMGGFINSFEYPFMMFAYDIGILGTILIYILILFVPVLIYLKNKSYFLLILFLAISLYINGQNDIANYADYMGQFCFFIMVMVNMSYLIKRRREEKIDEKISNV